MSEDKWDQIIESRTSLFNVRIIEIFKYRDLLFLFVRRNLVSQYKQTLLGPVWYFISPILTTITFTFIFGNVAGISTDGLPKPLFYLSGITCWRYFASSLTKTSSTFQSNAKIFGKVYFPRIVVPLAATITNVITLGIQLLLFLAVYGYYILFEDQTALLKPEVLLFPFLVLTMLLLGLGLGMLISSLTTKYRDLNNLLAFGMQLLMYATPVIYPLSSVPAEYRGLILLNPVTPLVEAFRYMYLSAGSFDYLNLLYSVSFAFVVFILGVITFNRTEKNFIDTV